jgi:hypothetical protein
MSGLSDLSRDVTAPAICKVPTDPRTAFEVRYREKYKKIRILV